MAISDADLLTLRRKINEPNASGSYPDNVLKALAEEHAYTESRYPDADATVYDLNGLAASIWEEKAAALAERFDFTENGVGDYRRSQTYQHAVKMAAYFQARRKTRSRRQTKAPREATQSVLL